MNHATAEALHRLNRRFYRERAGEFDATRRRPWPGWTRALDAYRAAAGSRRPGWILDLGCGNGRLGAFLAERVDGGHRYLGLDSSPPLLAAARRFPGAFPGARLVAADVVDGWPLGSDGLDLRLVVAFGLLHHVAGHHNRLRLMRRIGRCLAPGGVAAVSFWQFADRPRFRRRVAAWRDVDPAELEPGDHLLRWGDGDARRYCHHVDDAEAAELARVSGLEVVDRYRSDGDGGDLNLYLVLRAGLRPAR